MGRYVDGFVLPVPEGKLDEYKKMASKAGKIWMKHGALQFVESVGEDLAPTMGDEKIRMFPEMVKTKSGETVVFSFIVFKSRKHRDEVNAKVMKDPFMDDPKNKDMSMPFDMKRMAYGGFNAIVDLK